ncbi:GNAT family N-acetyltransferase [Dactylosporangium sp. AC04546]|uniref:GNAT family N-acetyltransferase n=1 Tax=Dactylosporangium sp. AC04546 TaxID=2862460 RepID=UPI001EDF6A4F|nr:GNAT family N-acetyltransferase [Dactylosporangium sp. AC04546]WVK78337.1 GNAT family N-acetyltransferase [Dactylosporangium sp. AC04546]
MIEVAGLRESDRAVWQELFAGYHEFYGRTWPAERFDEAWQAFRDGQRVHALGARIDGELVGIVHFLVHASTSSRDVCYLQDLFTDPAVRGRGVGRALIGAVEEWARERGLDRVYWHTRADNVTARQLYDQVAEHRGFISYVIPL